MAHSSRPVPTRGPFDPGGQPRITAPHDLLLGLFAWNVAGGVGATRAQLEDPGARRDFWRWPSACRLLQEAERIGCELQVPFGRWTGQHGRIGFNDDTLDFLAVASAPATATERILLPSTSHLTFGFHPVQLARWGASLDVLSSGRWALNVVAGWIRDEAEMFGEPYLDHGRRYELCDEFTTLMKLCWSEEAPFDFHGDFFHAHDVLVRPRPVRAPRPILVNAGSSPAGMDYAARHCDWLFVVGDPPAMRATSNEAQAAAARHGRRLQVATFCYSVWDANAARARAEFERHRANLDDDAVNWLLFRGLDQPGRGGGTSFAPSPTGGPARSLREAVGDKSFERYGLGIGSHQLIGDYDQVAEEIRHMHRDCGLDGILFTWHDQVRGLQQLEDHILPRLRAMGLRR
ncbi:MAG: LLM class flavin-dependent oxidoreductase [Gammaproteobacteria bacterium]